MFNFIKEKGLLIIGIAVFVFAAGFYYYSKNSATVSTSDQTPTQVSNQSVVPETTQPQPTTLCVASDLEGSASWEGSGSSLKGAVKITNRSNSTCNLEGVPVVSILSGSSGLSSPLKIDQSSTDDSATVTLGPGDIGYLNLDWNNWCGTAPKSAQIKIQLSDAAGYLLVPFFGTNGSAQNFTPSCTDTKSPSTLYFSYTRVQR